VVGHDAQARVLGLIMVVPPAVSTIQPSSFHSVARLPPAEMMGSAIQAGCPTKARRSAGAWPVMKWAVWASTLSMVSPSTPRRSRRLDTVKKGECPGEPPLPPAVPVRQRSRLPLQSVSCQSWPPGPVSTQAGAFTLHRALRVAVRGLRCGVVVGVVVVVDVGQEYAHAVISVLTSVPT
jgi:hypothetical protein